MLQNKFQGKYRIPSARWRNWDYGDEGAYFVTICTKRMKHYFGEIVNGEMNYTVLGKIVQQEWLKSIEIRPDMQLDMEYFQIMPNHVHGIVVIGKNEYNTNVDAGCTDARCTDADCGDARCRDAMHGVSTVNTEKPLNHFGPQSKNLSSIMRGFKSAVTTQARLLEIPFGWQTRFHDHVIRDDDEFRRIANYIECNPANWEEDRLNKSQD